MSRDTLGVAALARAITSLAHGKCCWEPAIDAGDILAALSPSEKLVIAGPEFAALLSAVTDDRHWDRLPARIRAAAQPFLPTADDVRGILATPVTPEGG